MSTVKELLKPNFFCVCGVLTYLSTVKVIIQFGPMYMNIYLFWV